MTGNGYGLKCDSMKENQESLTAGNILFCNCGGDRINHDLLKNVERHLMGIPARVTKLSDLCGLAAVKDRRLSDIPERSEEYLVIGCYPRTMSLLIDQVSGQSRRKASFKHINLIESTYEDVISQLNTIYENNDGDNVFTELSEGSDWPSWYPIIDYSRCTDCGQCADFCLFGVYEKSEHQVSVVNPGECKNNCPACARICPATAIIFPKYRIGGAIGGSDNIDEEAEQHRQTHDLEAFLGSDIYAALQKRKSKRESIIKKEAMNKALTEREEALNRIKEN
jgi:NAD-dependent dihydropyrimidine dehydrogenase PreA subunit